MDDLTNSGKILPQRIARQVLAGAFAGIAGGLLMSAAMAVFKRFLPRWQQYPLPPRIITGEMVDRADAESLYGEPEMSVATSTLHLGYSAAAGAGYAIVAPQLPRSLFLNGLISGLSLWAFGYLGWLPAFNILSPATKHPPERSALMIASHLVWAWTTGWLLERFDARG